MMMFYYLNFRCQQVKKSEICEGSFVMSIFKKFGFHKVTRFNALEAIAFDNKSE